MAGELNTEFYDNLDRHMAVQPDMARAMVPMAMLMAWAVNQHLVSEQVLQQHERLVLRVRFQEVGGSELLAACGGDLRRDMFNAEGQRFLDRFYPEYLCRFKALFGGEVYALEDDLSHYQPLAQMLTASYMQVAGRARQGQAANFLSGIRQRWKKLWQ